jgi:hypothetical protein
LQKRKEEEIIHITEHIHMDMSRIECKYEHIMEKLGAESIQQVKDKIINEVIPHDIHM